MAVGVGILAEQAQRDLAAEPEDGRAAMAVSLITKKMTCEQLLDDGSRVRFQTNENVGNDMNEKENATIGANYGLINVICDPSS